ncbi:type VI secretion system tube protein TssD [Sinomicrobium sp.]
MSFLSKLTIDNEEMVVLRYRMSMLQDTDHSDRPAADPRGGRIRVLVELTKSTSLFDWMRNPSQIRDGEFVFYRRDGMSKMRGLKFKKAYCVSYEEAFDADDSLPMRAEITIVAQEIDINGSRFGKNWPMAL